MGVRINTNLPSLQTLRNVDGVQTQLAQAMERLSTGLRLNSPGDDPSSFVIAASMRDQISGIQQAATNAQDGIYLLKTSDAALGEISDMLQSMRSVAVQSANLAVNDTNTLQANQSEIQTSIEAINRIASNTQFGRMNLLDGTAGLSVTVTDPTDILGINLGSTFQGSLVQAGPVTLTRVGQATQATAPLSSTFALATSTLGATGGFVLNGVAFSISPSETVQQFVNQVNSASPQTGVKAAITGTAPNLNVTLTSNNYGSQYGINVSDPAHILNATTQVNATGVDAVFSADVTTSDGVKTALFTGGRGVGDTGLQLKDSDGDVLLVSSAGNAAFTTALAGQVSSGTLRFQIGRTSSEVALANMPSVAASNLGAGAVAGYSVANLDVTAAGGAQAAIQVIDAALDEINKQRGDLGAIQRNALENAQTSLQTAQQNLTSSLSQITDADVATEVTEQTRLQILEQSGVAMLAQANQLPTTVLKLLG